MSNFWLYALKIKQTGSKSSKGFIMSISVVSVKCGTIETARCILVVSKKCGTIETARSIAFYTQ